MMKNLLKITEISTLPKNHIVSKLWKKWIPNFNSPTIEDLNEDCVKISRPYLLYYPKNKKTKSYVTDGPGRAGPVHRFI